MNKLLVGFLISIFAPALCAVLSHATVDSRSSRVIITNSRQYSNGMSRMTVTVHLADSQGVPESGKIATIHSDNPEISIIQPAATDLSGYSTGYLTSNMPLDAEIWATVDGVTVLPNLINNPSAEIGGAAPSGWSQFSNQAVVSGEHEYKWNLGSGSDSPRALGLFMSDTNFGTYEISWLQSISHPDLTAGTTYSVEVLTRGSTDYYSAGSPAGVYLTATNVNSINATVTSSRTFAAAMSGAWSRMKLESVNFPATASQIEIGLDLVRSSGTVYFDGVRVALRPSVRFSVDRSSPSPIASSAPTFLVAVPGESNGSIKINWKAVGNDGPLWPNDNGSYEVRITDDFSGLAVSSWTVVPVNFAPAAPGSQETLVIAGLQPGTTYQVAVRALDQSGNKPEFGITAPVFARSGVAPINILSIDQGLQTSSFGRNPAFSGTTQAGAGLKISIDGIPNGQTYADYSGRWMYRVGAPLSEGSHLAAVQAFDSNGNTSNSLEFAFQVGSDFSEDSITKAYPNPVRVSAGQAMKINVSMTSTKQAQLLLYDLRGVELAVLADKQFDLGTNVVLWNGKDSSGNPIASGSYVLVLKTGNQKLVKHITVLR